MVSIGKYKELKALANEIYMDKLNEIDEKYHEAMKKIAPKAIKKFYEEISKLTLKDIIILENGRLGLYVDVSKKVKELKDKIYNEMAEPLKKEKARLEAELKKQLTDYLSNLLASTETTVFKPDIKIDFPSS